MLRENLPGRTESPSRRARRRRGRRACFAVVVCSGGRSLPERQVARDANIFAHRRFFLADRSPDVRLRACFSLYLEENAGGNGRASLSRFMTLLVYVIQNNRRTRECDLPAWWTIRGERTRSGSSSSCWKLQRSGD